MKAIGAWRKDRVITISKSQSPDAILQVRRPCSNLQGQSPGIIPARGIALGPTAHLIFSANGAAHREGDVVSRGCPGVTHDGSGFQPLMVFSDDSLGRCPRLGWDAPLALETVSLDVSSPTTASRRFLAEARDAASCVSSWSTKAIS